jgi:hypothetical protein
MVGIADGGNDELIAAGGNDQPESPVSTGNRSFCGAV